MAHVLQHRNAHVHVEDTSDGRRDIRVELLVPGIYAPVKRCVTSYPIDLIEYILHIKGPGYLCDEILREESPGYVQRALHYDLLAYRDAEDFRGRRILDFGCGSGASTVILARMFPHASIVGIELDAELLSIARRRVAHYGCANVELLLSPTPQSLPPGLGHFDYVVLSAVYEHLLPKERRTVLRHIWSVLKPEGVLFLNQTPWRYFPVETHTTGLPFINYLPDALALSYARWASRSQLQGCGWNELLRRGIRGASVREILNGVGRAEGRPVLLEPQRLGLHDRIDLWWAQSEKKRHLAAKRVFRACLRACKVLTGATLVPYLSIAIAKRG